MKISIEISAATTRRVIALGVIGAGLVAGSVAWAKLKVWETSPPQTLNAEDLNGNFGELDEQIKALQGEMAALRADATAAAGVRASVHQGGATTAPRGGQYVNVDGLMVQVNATADTDVDIEVALQVSNIDTGTTGAECKLRLLVDGKVVGGPDFVEAYAAVGKYGEVPWVQPMLGRHRVTLPKGPHSVSAQLGNTDYGTGICNAERGRLRVQAVR